jgi:peptidoglycan/LPS O-acetylase OafA/YrhL
MPYSAPLDGIRAIAILAVLVFHISRSALRGGFTGVDVFFVLSGFLITSIILHDLRNGQFSIREFYLRRIQRLLPNVVLMVLAVLLLWTVFMPPMATFQTGRHALWAIFNLSNFYIMKFLGGYWGNAAEWSPLTHTWSLAIEEQFYLVFPASLLLLARFQPGRVRSWLAAAALVSFGLCLVGTYTLPTETFYLLPTRVWELLIGAALAAHRTPVGGLADPQPALGVKAQEAIGFAGLGMILIGFVFIHNGNGFPGLLSLAPTVGTTLVLWSVMDGKTKFSHGLSSPFMVKTGKLSYSIYVWHWPLITLGKALADEQGLPQVYGALAGAVLGLLLAWVAYTYVEQPLRKRGGGRSRRFMIIATGFALAALGAIAVTGRAPVADPAQQFDRPSFLGELYSAGKIDGTNNISQSIDYYDVYFPRQEARPGDSWRTGGVIHPYGGGTPKVVVLGSSHALMYSKLIDDICRERSLSVAFLAMDYGTPAFFESPVNPNFASQAEAQAFDQARRKWLRDWHPQAVLVIDRWDGWASRKQGFDLKLRSFLQEVAPLAGRVLFVTQAPVIAGAADVNLRELVTRRFRRDGKLPRLYPDRNEALRLRTMAIAQSATKDFPNLRVLRADLPFYNADGSVKYACGRAFFYANDNHLTTIGTDSVRALFEHGIAEATMPNH